jgi:hypothetical protein
MSFALQARQRFADSPEYLIPCPMCSFLGHAELGGDVVRGPDTYAARNGRLMVTVCCRFSGALFSARGGTRGEIAATWREMLVAAFNAEPFAPGKIKTTMGRLASKGYLPCSFPIPQPIDV